ncbi:peptidase C13, legumain asparaginyl peptidase [Microvirga sp. KLBC 81]|uniref:C13 family peptidase n=1 Tax=Microvirga sp. KLBC 81 TaxID=1862707 RepID=UPI000D5235DE|nr:C13 family peptidase [Microvirga sp. KLBC 81]PVE22567.1 peptidase C13, legumain asparaginyl peptidase [Microvirga sp. KLBC 81]
MSFETRGLKALIASMALAIGLSSAGLAQPSSASRLAPSQPGTDVYILSFGLWGPQSVFESEAKGAARVLEASLKSKGRTIVGFNSKRSAGATPQTIRNAIQTVGRVIDPDDVLVFFLTSHGSTDGAAIVTRDDHNVITPDNVQHLLQESRARYRVVIVSACYSGVFARKLADERTLVITAASADRSSFGCRDGATWTYFGDAFFNKAMRGERRLDIAFEKARLLVTRREQREGFDPSNPQIAGGSEVLARLSERETAPSQQPCRVPRANAQSAAC